MADKAFCEFGNIEFLPGRNITSKTLKDADVLLVRSITNVNQELLEGTKVKFVGSATAGIDHVDIDYLENNNIYFCHAPGSNSNSVAEYVVSGLLNISRQKKINLSGLTIGIIGYGHVGTIVNRITSYNVCYTKLLRYG